MPLLYNTEVENSQETKKKFQILSYRGNLNYENN